MQGRLSDRDLTGQLHVTDCAIRVADNYGARRLSVSEEGYSVPLYVSVFCNVNGSYRKSVYGLKVLCLYSL